MKPSAAAFEPVSQGLVGASFRLGWNGAGRGLWLFLSLGCLVLVAEGLLADPGLPFRLWNWGVTNRRSPTLVAGTFDFHRLNRFRGWPLDMRPNVDCALPEDVMRGLAWDDAGRSYAVLDAYRVLFSHGRPRPGLRLSFWTGERIIYRLVETDLTTFPAGRSAQGPFVAQLQDPLPPTVRPLPVMPAELGQRWRGNTVIVFARGGQLGAQTLADVSTCARYPGQKFLIAAPDQQHPDWLWLNVGDSGCAALIANGEHYYLAGSAHSIVSRTTPPADAGAALFNAFYFLPSYVDSLAEMGVKLGHADQTATPAFDPSSPSLNHLTWRAFHPRLNPPL